MKKIVCMVYIIGFLVPSIVFSSPEEPIVVGIIEFDEKTGIDQENAAVVIPEILITHLKNIGKYKLAERVLLQKVLEEQELQVSGITDEETAAKVGQIFGLDAFIVGSAMKVGENITISGRVIDTQTGEIIAAGAIEFTNLNQLNKSLEELAYLLSGFSITEYRRVKFEQEISKNRFGVRIGSGYTNNPDYNLGSVHLAIGVYYQGRYIDVDFLAPMSIGGNSYSVMALINIMPFAHLGFGIGGIWGSDEHTNENSWVLGKESNIWHYYGVLFGISYRATENLRIGFYMGTPLVGDIRIIDKDNNEYYHDKIKIFSSFPSLPGLITMEYRFSDQWSVNPVLIWNGVEADIEEFRRGQNIILAIMLGYGFSL